MNKKCFENNSEMYLCRLTFPINQSPVHMKIQNNGRWSRIWNNKPPVVSGCQYMSLFSLVFHPQTLSSWQGMSLNSYCMAGWENLPGVNYYSVYRFPFPDLSIIISSAHKAIHGLPQWPYYSQVIHCRNTSCIVQETARDQCLIYKCTQSISIA